MELCLSCINPSIYPQAVAEMEGVTHGIRPDSEGPGGVIEKLPLEEEPEDSRTMQSKKKKALRLEQKYQKPPSTPQAAPPPPKSEGIISKSFMSS